VGHLAGSPSLSPQIAYLLCFASTYQRCWLSHETFNGTFGYSKAKGALQSLVCTYFC
jgi:hypothetical protein